jgi:hypothetical protein
MGIVVVEILWALGGLNAVLLYLSFSCAKTFYDKGRRRGMEEATRELSRGISSHCELEGKDVPERVAIALKRLKEASSKPWNKGHAAGVRRKAPATGKLRVDFSLTELLQLSWLAHLGFQHMMPNYRGFEVHRFSGPDDAREGASAVGKIESAIPAKERPFGDLSTQVKGRQKLICDWWQAPPSQIIA